MVSTRSWMVMAALLMGCGGTEQTPDNPQAQASSTPAATVEIAAAEKPPEEPPSAPPPAKVAKPQKACAPATWKTADMAKAMGVRQDATMHILMWDIIEDERPLLLEMALVWARFHNGKEEQWALGQLYRHPRESSAWHPGFISHTPPLVRGYEEAPDNREAEQLIADAEWEIDTSWTRHDSGLCAGLWKAAMGAEPPAELLKLNRN